MNNSDVCVVCALPDELRALIDVFAGHFRVEFETDHGKDGWEFRRARIVNNAGEPLDVTVSCPPKMGPLEAGLHCKAILGEFRPRFAAMTGICAGDRREVFLGDLIVAERAFTYDAGKFKVNDKGEPEHLADTETWHPDNRIVQYVNMFTDWEAEALHLPRPISLRQQKDWLINKLLKPSTPRIDDISPEEREQNAPNWKKIVNRLQTGTSAILNKNRSLKNKSKILESVFTDEAFPFRDPPRPKCRIAAMASGSAVRTDNPFDWVQKPVRKAFGIDMEGAAFYRAVADFPGMFSLLVKGVCDFADSDKDDSHHEYAARLSAFYMLSFIRAYVNEKIMPKSELKNGQSRRVTKNIAITNSQVGVLGDNATIRDGIHIGGHTKIVHGTYVENQYLNDKNDTADPEELREAYLNRVFWETGDLPLKGIDPKAAGDLADSRMNLGAVYTALMTIHSRHDDRRAALFEKMAMGDMPDIEPKTDERMSALEMLNTHQHLVLLGDPGSGKSTFVNFVAWCLAGEGLKKKDANLKLLTQPLPSEKEGGGEDGTPKSQPWEHGAILPIRVILRDFAATVSGRNDTGAHASDLWEFVTGELKTADMEQYAPHLRRELREKGGLLMLDGLDEVPEAEEKRVRIKEMVEDFRKSHPRCRILITSRTYAYQKQDWRIPKMAETVLALFSQGQIGRFVDRWYDYVAVLEKKSDKSDAQGRAELLKRAIFKSRRLLELAQRPILLTLMASLHSWRGGTLPERREELYADTMDLLLDWWEGSKLVRDRRGCVKDREPSLSEWLGTDRNQVRGLLGQLAFEAHANQADLRGTADIPEKDLIAGLMSLTDSPDVKPRQVVNYISQRAGLLVPRGVGVYTFPHRTFQEYLAACWLTDQDFPELTAKLFRKDPNRWREVALLVGAKAARGIAASVWMLADALCHRDPGECVLEPDIWGAHLAGQLLVESANLKKVSDANRIKSDRIRQWLVRILGGNELPALERVRAGNNLARLDDPRFDPEHWYLPNDEDLGFVGIPAGKFIMGSDEQKDAQAFGDETPQHEVELTAYRIAKYPVTKAQYRAFVVDSGYDKTDKRWETYGEDNHPVVYVTWHDACAYCDWLTEKLKDRGWKISLPTEAQWEKAARGTDGQVYPYGNKPDKEKMNYADSGIGATSPVGCFPAGKSPFGIFDMAGNVWEWCGDDWHCNYTDAPSDGSAWVDDPRGSNRVFRGGYWGDDARYCRSAFRFRYAPSDRTDVLGFRLLRSVTP